MSYQKNFYDKFIKYKKFSPYIKSIKFLYPADIILQYKKDLDLKGIRSLFFFAKILKRSLSFFYGMMKNFLQLKNNSIYSKKSIVIISHHLKSNKLPKNDFYFGKLFMNLKKKNIDYQKLLINQSEFHSNFLNKNNNEKNIEVINRYCSFIIELKILLIQMRELFLILFFHKDINTPKKFLFSATFSIFEQETVFALRMYFFMKEYIDRYSPDILLFTYEGYPWERMCIKAARDSKKKIKCIGYQHSIIFDNLNPLNRNFGQTFDPDFIWASGNHSFKILKRAKELKKVKIIKVGNFIKNSQLKSNFKIKKLLKKKVCLVLPVGIYQECVELFNFTFQCSSLNKNIDYIWRLHPVIKKSVLSKMMKIDFNNLPTNIKFSQGTLENDTKKSDCVLYKSSTSAIQALQYGCIPIYLDQGEKFKFDAIQNFKIKKIVNNYRVFFKIVIKIDKKIKKQVKLNAIHYKKDIYESVNYTKTFNFFKSLI